MLIGSGDDFSDDAGGKNSAGCSLGVDSFNSLVNSEGRRKVMSTSDSKYMGVGIGLNADSKYTFFTTQVSTK